jgi:hypothetical protein
MMKAKALNRITWKESPIWLRCLGVFVFTNFATFWIVAVLLGGDAVNGKIENGHYFLSSHGHLQEVSKSVFLYSKIHCLSAMAGIPILMIAVVQYNYRKS